MASSGVSLETEGERCHPTAFSQKKQYFKPVMVKQLPKQILLETASFFSLNGIVFHRGQTGGKHLKGGGKEE